MKNVKTRALILSGALTLAACSGSDPVATDAANATALPSLDNVAGGHDGVPSADGGAPPDADRGPATGGLPPLPPIGTALHGRWGMTPGDCDVASGAAKGHLVVAADGLRFFESRAVPIANVETSPNSFSADFSFTGEGQNWKKYQALSLDGDRLVRTESSPMASFTYARCD